MNEMIERVARALMDADYQHREPYHVARAAIAAMRGPTKEMLRAQVDRDWSTYRGEKKDIWQAMIDAALNEADDKR